MKQVKWVVAAAAGLLLSTPYPAEAISISLRPDMDLTAPAGSTIGWGYEIINDSAFWLSFDNINASLDDPAEGDVNTGVFDLPIVDPGATLILDYDQISFFGLVELTLAPLLPVGTAVSGTAFGSYQIYSDAGLANFEGAEDWSVDFSAQVSEVPEPGTWLLLGTGLLAVVRHRIVRAGSRSRA